MKKTRFQGMKECGFNPDGSLMPSDDLARYVREQSGDTVILQFSRGKDSIAMWLYLRERFRVIPVYFYSVPGLSYVEDSLAYYEDVFQTRIMRLPMPLFYDYLRLGHWQTPEQVALFAACHLPEFDYADLEAIVAQHHNLDAPYTAVGMRLKDSLERREMMLQRGTLGSMDRRFYFAIWDWDIHQVAAIIKQHGVKLPIDYRWLGRTVTGFDYQLIAPIKRHRPADYERIREWFPLIDAEIFRYENMAHYGNS